MKSRRKRWAGHVARMGRREIRVVQGFGGGKLKESDYLKDIA